MTSTAALWTAWQVGSDPRNAAGLALAGPSGALPAGVSFLPQELGGARLVVEAAFGANLADVNGTSWVWYDISADVHFDPGVQIQIGKQSANTSTAPPAQCSFTLDNTSNNYTQFNPLAKYWPNVREGTPIRVRLIISGNSYQQFQGRAIGWAPQPDSTGVHQVVVVTAAGRMRVLGQASQPVKSPIYFAIISAANTVPLIAYWPMEDSSGASSIASGVSGGTAMSVDSTVALGSFDPASIPFTASLNATWGTSPLANFKGGGSAHGVVPAGGTSSAWTVQIGAYLDPFNLASETVVVAAWSTPGGTYQQWQLVYDNTVATGGTRVVAIKNDGSSVAVASSAFKAATYVEYRIDAVQSGGNINVTLNFILDSPSGTLTSATLSAVSGAVTLNPSGASHTGDMVMGHLRVWNTNSAPNFQTQQQKTDEAFWSYVGDTPVSRLTRICSDNGIQFQTLGFYDSSVLMGPQQRQTTLAIAQSCETAEAGWLYDGLNDGLSIMAPSQRYNQFSQFTLDASKGEVIPDFWPIPDDLLRVNRATVSRLNGSTVTYEDDTGPVGINAVGEYAGNAPLSGIGYYDDSYVGPRARFEVKKGTYFGYRWPTVKVNMRKISDRAAVVAAMIPGLMFTISPLPTHYQPQYGTDPLQLIAEGWTVSLTNLSWDIVFNCSMQDVYGVWQIGDSQRGRLGTNGHTLAGDVAAGASTVSLATPAGMNVWTTAAGDFPMTLLIDGIKVTLTAISGLSSPQTGTVDTTNTPIPRFIQSGQPVTMWKNGVVKL